MTIHYEFPVITHINDVLEAIEGRPEFIVAVKDGYTVINYVVAGNDTFPPVDSVQAAILRECRGIVFDNETGEIIARRFHKFFNLGEREELFAGNIDLYKTHHIPLKLDGSMITPIPVNGEIRWGTKMGLTDVALQAEKYVEANPKYAVFALAMIMAGQTPIFEWCSNKQRIVIDHTEDSLVLLAIRNNVSGRYNSRKLLEVEAEYFGIPIVSVIDTANNIDELSNEIRAQEGTEGVVLTFDNGHMLKIKSDWYVRLHRTKDAISSERKIVDLMLNGNLDDLKPLMTKEDFDIINSYETDFTDAVYGVSVDLCGLWSSLIDVDRKTFALHFMKSTNPMFVPIIFKLYDKNPDNFIPFITNMIIDKIAKSTSNNKNFDAVKEAFFPRIVYNYGIINE